MIKKSTLLYGSYNWRKVRFRFYLALFTLNLWLQISFEQIMEPIMKAIGILFETTDVFDVVIKSIAIASWLILGRALWFSVKDWKNKEDRKNPSKINVGKKFWYITILILNIALPVAAILYVYNPFASAS